MCCYGVPGHYTPHYLLLVTAVDVGDNIVTGAGCGRAHCAPPDTSDTRTAPDTVLFLLLPGHLNYHLMTHRPKQLSWYEEKM